MRTRGSGIDAPGDPPGPTSTAALDAVPSLGRSEQIDWLRERLTEGGGIELLHEAGRLGGDSVAIAIAAWELLFGGRPGLSAQRRGQLERACLVLDRLQGRGAGTSRLLSWMHGVACDLEDRAGAVPVGFTPALGRHPDQPAPATLNYFVARLRCEARGRRRAWRRARAETEARGSSPGGTGG